MLMDRVELFVIYIVSVVCDNVELIKIIALIMSYTDSEMMLWFKRDHICVCPALG